MNSLLIKIRLLVQSAMLRTGCCSPIKECIQLVPRIYRRKQPSPAFCVVWKLMANPVSTKSIFSGLLGVFVHDLANVQTGNLSTLKSQMKIETFYYHSLKLLLLKGREIFLHISLSNSRCGSVIRLTQRCCGTANAVFALGGLYAAWGTSHKMGREETMKEVSDQAFMLYFPWTREGRKKKSRDEECL